MRPLHRLGGLGSGLEAEVGGGPTPILGSGSPTADEAERTWASVHDFEREVAEARIYDGVHYRTSTEVGTVMGRLVGELTAERFASNGR